MTYYSDDDYVGEDDHGDVPLRPPFVALWRTTHTNPYDVAAHMAANLRLPGKGLPSPVTKDFLLRLYVLICDAWDRGNSAPTTSNSKRLILDALYDMPRTDDLADMMYELGWGDLSITVTPNNYDDMFRRVTANRLAQQVRGLLLSAHRAARKSAA